MTAQDLQKHSKSIVMKSVEPFEALDMHQATVCMQIMSTVAFQLQANGVDALITSIHVYRDGLRVVLAAEAALARETTTTE